MVYTLLSGPMAYTHFPCFPEEMVFTIAFSAPSPRGRATDRGRRGATVVVYTLFSPGLMPTFHSFSLRSCRRSSVNFLALSARNSLINSVRRRLVN